MVIIFGFTFTDYWLFLQVVIGMDVAASEFYDNKDKTYDLNFKEEVAIDSIL